MAHNCVIYSHETAWLKKIDSQTICKLLLPNLGFTKLFRLSSLVLGLKLP